jgi:hypothetical protein
MYESGEKRICWSIEGWQEREKSADWEINRSALFVSKQNKASIMP